MRPQAMAQICSVGRSTAHRSDLAVNKPFCAWTRKLGQLILSLRRSPDLCAMMDLPRNVIQGAAPLRCVIVYTKAVQLYAGALRMISSETSIPSSHVERETTSWLSPGRGPAPPGESAQLALPARLSPSVLLLRKSRAASGWRSRQLVPLGLF